MTTEERKKIVHELLGFLPRTIVDRLMLDLSFRNRNDFRLVATVNFPGVSVPFARNDVLAVVGRVFRAGAASETVTDKAGGTWQVSWSEDAGWPVMTSGDQQVSLAGLWFVAQDDATRRALLERVFRENRAVGPDLERWRDLLTTAPIDVEDIESFQDDIARTPTQNVIAIRSGMIEGTSRAETLTPTGLHYYERLVGARGDADTLTTFLAGPATAHFSSLLEWNVEEGLRQALLSGSHANLVPSLPEGFDPSILERVIQWAAARGDRISQIGAFELGMRHLAEVPSLTPSLASIVEQIREDNPEDQNGRLILLSNLFTFVDGSIIHMGYLQGAPPYWRRLASLAQASMIEREFVRGGIAADTTNNWLKRGRGAPFYLQNTIDGRLEPRWLPDFATPQQWKQELIGRIVGAAERNAQAMAGTALEPLIRSMEPGSLRSQMEFPLSYLPGPLEGGLDHMIDAPPEFEALVRQSVSVSPTAPDAFNALVNTCLIFRTPADLAQQAAEAIKAAKYRVRENTESSQTFAMLSGLAMVAAVTRSEDLAREVRVLARLALRRVASDMDVIQSFRIGMIAANAFADLYEWRKFVGEWVTELAFSDLDGNSAALLHSFVDTLCILEPALWATLSRADAALTSFINAVQPA